MRDTRPRRFQTNFSHGVAELDPVFGLVDGFGIGTNHFDTIFRQRAIVEQRQGNVQRGLPAHRRQHCVGAFFFDNLGNDFGGNRLNISRVGHIRIGHDRRRIGVDEDDAIALFAQRLARLRSRIIKLARLPDNDGAGADDEDGFYVSTFGHFNSYFQKPSPSDHGYDEVWRRTLHGLSKTDHASCASSHHPRKFHEQIMAILRAG